MRCAFILSVVSFCVLPACDPNAYHVPPAQPSALPAQMPSTSVVTPSADGARSGGVWETCLSGFQRVGSANDDLERMTRSCGPRTQMAPYGAALQTDEQAADGPVERWVLEAVPGACYRVLAVATEGVQAMEIGVVAPDGELLASEHSGSSWVAVPSKQALCPKAPGGLTLETSVVRGKGRILFQVLSDRPTGG